MRFGWMMLFAACAVPEADVEPLTCLDMDADQSCDHLRADWRATATVPSGTQRDDVFQLGDDLEQVREEGLQYVTDWPVEVSGVLLPYDMLVNLLDVPTEDDTLLGIRSLIELQFGYTSTDDIYEWLGIPEENEPTEVGPYRTPTGEAGRVGVTILPTEQGDALTFSCGACHAERLFGRTVIGLTNRQTRANDFFHLGSNVVGNIDDTLFAELAGATEGELAMLARTRERIRAVGIKPPQALGLDTSLAQVGLSLARRADDPYATRDDVLQLSPPEHPLETLVADSKPMVWWTLKYKTRWLSDGSITQGNPIFTNFLWNELGRGTDLDELEQWLIDNRRAVDTLTAAIFATEPPRWTDYFEASSIDEQAAVRGQSLFEAHCATCHGSYDKGWDEADADSRSPVERLETTLVRYHDSTPVLDVGTDLTRAQAMETFADNLNGLAISTWMETIVEPQSGYVPPPLDGIWARYPYMHNNAMPTLCDVLTPAAERTEVFYQGPSDDLERDFDSDCVGYPTGDAVPADWRTADLEVDTRREGLANIGHDSWLLDASGTPVLTSDDRRDLIMFLKTL